MPDSSGSDSDSDASANDRGGHRRAPTAAPAAAAPTGRRRLLPPNLRLEAALEEDPEHREALLAEAARRQRTSMRRQQQEEEEQQQEEEEQQQEEEEQQQQEEEQQQQAVTPAPVAKKRRPAGVPGGTPATHERLQAQAAFADLLGDVLGADDPIPAVQRLYEAHGSGQWSPADLNVAVERFGRQPAAIARLMAMLAYYLAAHPKGAYREQAEWPTVVALCAAVSALKMKLIQGRNLGEYAAILACMPTTGHELATAMLAIALHHGAWQAAVAESALPDFVTSVRVEGHELSTGLASVEKSVTDLRTLCSYHERWRARRTSAPDNGLINGLPPLLHHGLALLHSDGVLH